jgi:23S rRNA pseudouridine1911/1915/1917 synthase
MPDLERPQDATLDALRDEPDPASGDEPQRREGAVPPERHGERLDRMLVDLVPEYSRSHLQTLVEAGLVQVDARPVTTVSRRVRAGQRVQVELALPPSERPVQGEPMALEVVHEDDDIIVLDKPPGLVVHPAPGHWTGTLLNGLIGRNPACAALPRGGIVHRLDKDTSGLMVAARNVPAMVSLVRALARRDVQREYCAIAHGVLRDASTRVELPIGRDPVWRVRMAVVPHGRPSRTDVMAVASDGRFSLLQCRLHTGRTHQIRVHLAALGFPLVADALYGGAPALGLTRQALHAARLALVHPRSGRLLAFESPLPADLQSAWNEVLEGAAPRAAPGPGDRV